MNLFFDSLDALHQRTLNLDAHPDCFQCRHCQQSDQFVSHGFVYKKQHNGNPAPVGKRLFCANRHRRSGCGATLRLSVTEVLPRHRHMARTLQRFILGLLDGSSIANAYRQATGTQEPRHAYRWLLALMQGLVRYRCWLTLPVTVAAPFAMRCRRLRLLLPTLMALRIRDGESFVRAWQAQQQAPFLG